ncbi:MAG: hypothetical protein JW994_05070 [Candidatus Omnitrophica bacterium]|nr:hypothetical protein [Candidatus Omnitrophota bacterium]
MSLFDNRKLSELKEIGASTVIRIIGYTEITLGITTILGLGLSFLFAFSGKPVNVVAFVLISAAVSIFLGAGLILTKNWSRKLLLFFSGWVILTKLLIFMDILEFKGALITLMPDYAKNVISVFYHASIIILLSRETFRKQFL